MLSGKPSVEEEEKEVVVVRWRGKVIQSKAMNEVEAARDHPRRKRRRRRRKGTSDECDGL